MYFFIDVYNAVSDISYGKLKMKSLIKSLVASKEIAALERNKGLVQEYRRWLSEFPMISMTLDNLFAEMEGKQSLDACHPPMSTGPWTIDNLRYKLRALFKSMKPSDSKFDEEWQREFDRKHEQLTTAQTRADELQTKLDQAANLLVEKNREVNQLQLLCATVHHQTEGTINFLDRKVLEQLRTVADGKKLV